MYAYKNLALFTKVSACNLIIKEVLKKTAFRFFSDEES